MKKLLFSVLAVLIVFSGCKAEKIPTDYDFSDIAAETMAHIIEETPNPGHDSVKGEWSVIAAARYGAEIPEGWNEIYYENLCTVLRENDGVLSSTKHTNYSRAVIALTVIGKDITDVAGYNLLDNYVSMETITRQGLAGNIFALISLDCGNYELPEGSDVTREKLILDILEQEYEGGGWALMGENPDVDITAQVIQALAPYYEKDADVAAAVDRAVEHLSLVQKPDGGFYAWESENVQTAVQVVLALTSIGTDIRTDERFIKDGNWIGSYIMQYHLGGGAFCHTLGMAENSMATDQCMEAFIAIERFDSGKTSFYDFSDMR